MELLIGRRLEKNECVHHKDHDRQNNSPENLELVLRGSHSSEHRKNDIKNRKRGADGKWLGRI